MPPLTLTRQQLYDRVWSTPVHTLARELGLSDRGLGKLCTRHDIPVPPRGWWAEKAHGKRVKQAPLPPAERDYMIHFHGTSQRVTAAEQSPVTSTRSLRTSAKRRIASTSRAISHRRMRSSSKPNAFCDVRNATRRV